MNETNVRVMAFDAIEVPELKESKVRGKEYVSYGDNNRYPQFLWELYQECSDHQAIIDGLVGYVCGNGITTTNPQLQAFFNMVNPDETMNDLLRKLVLDYMIFGGFCPQVTPKFGGGLGRMDWVNFMNLRVNELETLVYHSKEWGNWGAKADVYPNYNRREINKVQLFYFKGNKTRGVYPIPTYNAAIKAIKTSIEIGNFHLNNICNSFQPSTIINFNNGEPKMEQKEEIERLIRQKFEGTKGSKIMTVWNESKEKGTEIQKLDADNFGEQFATLHRNTQQTIFTAHRITSPALFGIKMENTGFSKTEYREAFEIFNQTVVKSHQAVVLSELNKLLVPYFGKDLGLQIIPYEVNISDNG